MLPSQIALFLFLDRAIVVFKVQSVYVDNSTADEPCRDTKLLPHLSHLVLHRLERHRFASRFSSNLGQ